MDFNQSSQPSISLTETLRQSFLIPEFNPKQEELLPSNGKMIASNSPKIKVSHGNDDEDCDSWSLCEDDDVEEGEDITHEEVKVGRSSPRVIRRKIKQRNICHRGCIFLGLKVPKDLPRNTESRPFIDVNSRGTNVAY